MVTLEQLSQAIPDVQANRQYVDALFKYGYGRYATDKEFQSVLDRSGTGKVKDVAGIVLGKNSPFVAGSSVSIPQGSKAIDATKLTQSQQDLQKILGANIDTSNVDSQVAGLLSLYGKTTKEQQNVENLQQQYVDLSKTLGGEASDYQKELQKQGVPQAFDQIKELNLRGAQLQGQLEKFDVATQQLEAGIENQPIPTGMITGQKAQLNKQRTLEKMSIAADLSATAALSQAYQGNATLGQQLAQQAVDLKYKPILTQLNVLKDQIGFATDAMDRADTKRSNVISTLIDIRFKEIDEQKQKEKDIQLLAIEAAQNGAPLNVVTSMQSAQDIISATQLGREYIGSGYEQRTQLSQLAADAAANGAPDNVVNAIKNASDIVEASKAGGKYISGTATQIENLAADAAANGAPQSVIDKMRGAKNLADAAQIGSNYLKGSLYNANGTEPSSQKDFEFSASEVQTLLGSGLDRTAIQQIESEINSGKTVDDIINTYQFTDNQIQTIYSVFGQDYKPENKFITADYLLSLYGGRNSSALKQALKDGGYKHWYMNENTEVNNFLNDLMSTVEAYRQAGYSDEDILKQMQ